MTLFTWVQHSCTFNIVVSLFNHLCQMFVRRCTPSVRPSLLMFRPDHPIARISSPLVLYRVFALVLSLWRSDRNRMDSYRLSMVDVPEYPIASGTKGPWQQQRCDSLHCYEEWLGSVPTSDSHSPWKHSSILRPHATSILIQECCSSFINMALARTHYPFESQLSIHCNRLIDYYRHWLH